MRGYQWGVEGDVFLLGKDWEIEDPAVYPANPWTKDSGYGPNSVRWMNVSNRGKHEQGKDQEFPLGEIWL